MLTDLLPLLCCPLSRTPLRIVTEGEARQLELRFPGAESWLIAEDRQRAYPVREGIPQLIPEAAVAMES